MKRYCLAITTVALVAVAAEAIVMFCVAEFFDTDWCGE